MESSNLNSINLKEKKQKIFEIINEKGPSLPSAISREIGVSLLITSALLSDMRAEKTIRLSRLRIGGSPLYYFQGQEKQLEQFIKKLPLKEQEAVELLKKKEVIDEEKLQPAHRVALANTKDFAVPMQVKKGEDEKTFWRFHSISQEEAIKKINEILKIKRKEIREEKKDKRIEKGKEKETEKEKEKPIKSVRRKSKNKEEFKKEIFSWIENKNLRFVQESEDDNIFGVVSTKSNFGELNFLLITKQKKTINEADLSLAYQEGQHAKMPVLFLTTGKLTKKAQVYIKKLGKFLIVNFL